ncbi:uncharacterized protein LOC103723767 [Phoenix dactylifera]|uniref:Uncharacterized protein LOC103723767 n=1 Tax=Phoenix dactylifera TaxID=42345 RepID=A0A8B7D4P7_PHODC|nr:uncharacterized protein LOC103723767 [Phoenix dactylifera]
MEKEMKSQRGPRGASEPDFLLQWGNRKRLRCVKVRDEGSLAKSDGQKRTTTRVSRRVIGGEKGFPSPPPVRHPTPLHQRKSESAGSENGKSASPSSSPEKEDRFYTTRGSAAGCEENGGAGGEERKAMVLPRFFVSLSNKEKEEDFMAMKGCKLPQRPKKRSKLIQKCLLLVSPGAWLSDLSQERYEVREKKSSRKRRRGLKAMCMESDSE